MLFEAKWMDLEIILSKVSQKRERRIPYDITYTWNLNDTNKLIYKTEKESRTQKTNLWLQKREW